jgi:hypothetical protein
MLIANPLNSSELAFPILECFHIVGFAIAIGSIALVDFRLLGIGLRRQNAADLFKETGLWIVVSLSISVFAGLLLYSTDPDKYYLNAPFVFKMIYLVMAIVFNYTVHRKVILSSTPRNLGRVVACISLALWISVIGGGILVSFTAV